MRLQSKAGWICFLYLLGSCTSGTDEPVKQEKESVVKTVETTTVAKPNDTLFVREASAVFYSPDSLEIEKMKKEIGEQEFLQGADDYLFYLNESNEFLEGQDLPVAIVETEKVLQFISSPGNLVTIRMDTLTERWGIYLFKPGSAPHFADMMDIEKDYKTYFEKK